MIRPQTGEQLVSLLSMGIISSQHENYPNIIMAEIRQFLDLAWQAESHPSQINVEILPQTDSEMFRKINNMKCFEK